MALDLIVYFGVGLWIAECNISDEDFFDRFKNFPFREYVTEKQIVCCTLVLCALIWPWFIFWDIVRKIKE